MSPSAASTPSWSKYFLDIAAAVATRSKDPNTKVGCVIAGRDHEILSTGYNSFPRGIDDEQRPRLDRPEKYFWMEHAERNAIYNAARVGAKLMGASLYIGWLPCMDCARAIVQSGIKNVVVDWEAHQGHATERWAEDHKRTIQLFKEAGVWLIWYYPKEDKRYEA